jgi:hypothetical protein
MYRFFLPLLLYVACTPTPEKSIRAASDSLLPFLIKTVNPLLQNREATEAPVLSTKQFLRRTAMIRIVCGAVLLGLLLFWLWRRKQFIRHIREESLRQQLLRGQIESHFLFSAVNGLQHLIRKGNTDEATRFVQQLAQLFRLSLENARHPFVPLKNEMEALVSYLQLQQTLFDYQFDIALSCLSQYFAIIKKKSIFIWKKYFPCIKLACLF